MKGIPKEDLLDLLAMFPDDGIVQFEYIRGLYKSYADVYVSDKENGFYKLKTKNRARKELLGLCYSK